MRLRTRYLLLLDHLFDQVLTECSAFVAQIRTDILHHGLVPKDIRLIRRKDTGRVATNDVFIFLSVWLDLVAKREGERKLVNLIYPMRRTNVRTRS